MSDLNETRRASSANPVCFALSSPAVGSLSLRFTAPDSSIVEPGDSRRPPRLGQGRKVGSRAAHVSRVPGRDLAAVEQLRNDQ